MYRRHNTYRMNKSNARGARDSICDWTRVFDIIKSKSTDAELNKRVERIFPKNTLDEVTLLKKLTILFYKDLHGNTLLHYCAKHDKAEIATILLDFEYNNHGDEISKEPKDEYDDGLVYAVVESFIEAQESPRHKKMDSALITERLKKLKKYQQLLVQNTEYLTPVHYAMLNGKGNTDVNWTSPQRGEKSAFQVFLDHMAKDCSRKLRRKFKQFKEQSEDPTCYDLAYKGLTLAETNYGLNPLLESITRRKEEGIIMVLDHATEKINNENREILYLARNHLDYRDSGMFKFITRLLNGTDKQHRNIFHFCGIYGCHRLLEKVNEFFMKLKNCAIIEPSPLDSKITGINYDDGSTKDTFTKCILSLDRHKNLPIHFATSNGWPKCLKEMLGHLKGEYSAYEDTFNNFINQCSDGDNSRLINLAIGSNDLETVKLFLEEFEANPNLHVGLVDQNSDKHPLLEAAKSKPSIIRLLLDNKELNVKGVLSRTKQTALHLAAHHSPLIIDELNEWTFEKDLDFKTQEERFLSLFKDDENGCSPFHSAVISGKYNSVRKILEYFQEYARLKKENSTTDANQNQELRLCHLTANSQNVLHILAERITNDEKDYLEIAKMILYDAIHFREEDSEPKDDDNILMTREEITRCLKEQDKHSKTPLHLACKSGAVSLVELFLDVLEKLKLIDTVDSTKEDDDAENKTDLTRQVSLSIFAGRSKSTIRGGNKCLLESRDDLEQTPLFTAVEEGHLDIVRLLCEKNNELADHKDSYWNTPLHIAAKCGRLEIVKELVIGDTQADVQFLNHAKLTPLDNAAEAGHLEICEFLIQEGSEIDPKDLSNMTPLLLAAKNGRVKVLTMLLDKGADSSIKTSICEKWIECPNHPTKFKKVYEGGLNALELAIENGHTDCVRTILLHKKWKEFMKNSRMKHQNDLLETPMRMLLREMPDLAILVLNKSVKWQDETSTSDVYGKVKIDYTYINDLADVHKWSNFKKDEIGQEKAEESDYMYYWPVVYKKRSQTKSKENRNSSGKYQNEDIENNAANKAEKPINIDLLTVDANGHGSYHVLQDIQNTGKVELMEHPVVLMYLNRQFKLYGLRFFINDFIIYLLFVLLLNYYALIVPPRVFFDINTNENTTCPNITNLVLKEELRGGSKYEQFSYFNRIYAELPEHDCQNKTPIIVHWKYQILNYVLFFMTGVRLLLEIYAMFFRNGFSSYCRDYMNYIEMVLYGLTIYYLFGLQHDNPGFYYSKDFAHVCGSIAVFLSWMNLLLFIKKLPKLGIYVIMLEHCLITLMKFSVILGTCLAAFGITFHLLMGNKLPYQNWYVSILSVLVIMAGEQEYQSVILGHNNHATNSDHNDVNTHFTDELLFDKSVCYLIHTLCLILISILVMNLMTGLAVGDIAKINKDAQKKLSSAYIEENLIDNLYISYAFSSRAKRISLKICKFFMKKRYLELSENMIKSNEQKINVNYNFQLVKSRARGYMSTIFLYLLGIKTDYKIFKDIADHQEWPNKKVESELNSYSEMSFQRKQQESNMISAIAAQGDEIEELRKMNHEMMDHMKELHKMLKK